MKQTIKESKLRKIISEEIKSILKEDKFSGRDNTVYYDPNNGKLKLQIPYLCTDPNFVNVNIDKELYWGDTKKAPLLDKYVQEANDNMNDVARDAENRIYEIAKKLATNLEKIYKK